MHLQVTKRTRQTQIVININLEGTQGLLDCSCLVNVRPKIKFHLMSTMQSPVHCKMSVEFEKT